VMLPGLNGFDVCGRLRSLGHPASILMLTARDTVEDRVAGLDRGADDYLVKPFAFSELLARIRALLRRGRPAHDQVLVAGDLQMNTVTRDVRRGGREVELTSREYAVLEYLLRNAGHVLTRDQIADHVWGFEYLGGSNIIDVYVATLRRKLGGPRDAQLLHTIRGVGYQLRPPGGDT
jgi:DNA-binding response OmpR family regulator